MNKKILIILICFIFGVALPKSNEDIDIFSNGIKNTVIIKLNDKKIGTGFLYKSYVITAAHCHEFSETMSYEDYYGREDFLELRKINFPKDVAVYKPVTIKISSKFQLRKPSVAEEIFSVGNSYTNFAFNHGYYSSDGNNDRGVITIPIFPGDSGGPVYSMDSAIIGMVIERRIVDWSGAPPNKLYAHNLIARGDIIKKVIGE